MFVLIASFLSNCWRLANVRANFQHSSPKKRGMVEQETVVAVLEQVFEREDGYAVAREERTRLRKAGQFEKTESLQYGEFE